MHKWYWFDTAIGGLPQEPWRYLLEYMEFVFGVELSLTSRVSIVSLNHLSFQAMACVQAAFAYDGTVWA
jgi:hypothetical protein